MTIVNSARQMMETPIISISEGTSPIISYNYGAHKFDKIKKSKEDDKKLKQFAIILTSK